jgi:hypothetical protein
MTRAAPIRIVIVFALAVATGRALAKTDGELLGEAGIAGEWAIDCGKPPSTRNEYFVFATSDGGAGPTRSIRWGAKRFVSHLSNVQIVVPDRIRWTEVQENGAIFDIEAQITGSRMRTIQSTSRNGNGGIKNGIMIESGREVPFVSKCPVGQTSLVAVWDDCNQDKDHARAIQACTSLLNLFPASVPAFNSRAWNQFEAGNAAAALPDAERAVALEPVAAVLDTRGHVLEALGRRDEAIADYRRAIAPEPTNPHISETKAALARLLGEIAGSEGKQ